MSEAPLGDFPYLRIPAGFRDPNPAIPVAPAGRVPFWTGDRLQWVEGKVYQATVHADSGREFSAAELAGAVEKAVAELGGVPVTHSPIPGDVASSIDEDTSVKFVAGLGDIYNSPAHTYVVRRVDRLIWIHLCADSASAGWMIAESPN
ncbi:hypothetical protein ACF9IK_08030 [Kitasatospora hibisci]|uniref:hypothetical protein n=1 Tax=Kitasatospora hibisci TaxID=3369522 RepID=UPI0037553148